MPAHSKRFSVSLNGRLRVSAAERIREAVFAGMGIAIVSERMFEPELRNGLVETALSDRQLPEIDLWAVFPTGKLASAKVRAFTSFVEAGLTTFRKFDISRD